MTLTEIDVKAIIEFELSAVMPTKRRLNANVKPPVTDNIYTAFLHNKGVMVYIVADTQKGGWYTDFDQ